jgi:hypothetical protein
LILDAPGKPTNTARISTFGFRDSITIIGGDNSSARRQALDYCLEVKPGMGPRKKAKTAIFTIGHSTRPLDEFVELLRSHGVKRVIDIRTIPRSRHNPQFNGDTLGPSLRAARIGYVQLKKLGGLRHAKADSKNLGWHNASFRGFADYMQTQEFEAGLERAIRLAGEKPSALMCAEAVPWRCHRSMVADALTVRGFDVEHIVSGSKPQTHKLTSFARVRGSKITYPSEDGQSAMDFESAKVKH